MGVEKTRKLSIELDMEREIEAGAFSREGDDSDGVVGIWISDSEHLLGLRFATPEALDAVIRAAQEAKDRLADHVIAMSRRALPPVRRCHGCGKNVPEPGRAFCEPCRGRPWSLR